jgi:SSS family solute:Na+ symporter
MKMHLVDNGIIWGYLLLVFLVGFLKKSSNKQSDYILMGRRLTLPAFVMTLVSTWYGGILGVSEYSTSYGISNWVIFGLPYYVFGIIFALLVAKRAHARNIASLPELMHQTYGLPASRLASLWVLLLASPAPYILTLGFLLNFFLGLSLNLSILLGAVFSFAYIMRGGLAAVVNTDKLQFVLMFLKLHLLGIKYYL